MADEPIHLTRACTKCGVEKPLDQVHFKRQKKGRAGLMAQCRQCLNAYRMVLHFHGPQKRSAACALCGDVFTPSSGRQVRCVPCRPEWERIKKRNEYSRRGDVLRERTLAYARNNRAALAERQRERVRKIKEEGGERLEQYREYARNYMAEQRKRDPLRHRMSWGMRRALKQRDPANHWLKILGYSIADLRRHLERQFLPGMSWENMDRWQIDHIVPHRLFKYESVHDPDFKACWALTNLRPLWAEQNLKKRGHRTHLI